MRLMGNLVLDLPPFGGLAMDVGISYMRMYIYRISVQSYADVMYNANQFRIIETKLDAASPPPIGDFGSP